MSDSHLHRLHDAIHGSIDYAHFGSKHFSEAIEYILRSQFMRRLRRIKQLGFVSANYLSASHDRYTHSIGTMVMMRSLLERLLQTGALVRSDCPILSNACQAFPIPFHGLPQDERIAVLSEHLLLAALTQDIGELPYNFATSELLKPDNQLAASVEKDTAIDISGLEPKTIFSLAALQQLFSTPIMQRFHLPLVSFLVSGRYRRGETVPAGLVALRQMMDGVVDADRLDYVHRDAFHALGLRRDPKAVVASLSYYDAEGPVFSSSGPVADFFAMRATLWSSIYLHPANRFRTTLLTLVIRDLLFQLKRGAAVDVLLLQQRFGLRQEGVSLETFQELDDLWVDNLLIKLTDGGDFKFSRTRAKEAAKLLVNDGTEFKYYWIGPHDNQRLHKPSMSSNELPDTLFWDTYSNYQSHRLYDLESVRVDIDHYRYISNLMPLEKCSGPFNAMLTEQVSGLPMPGYVTIFRPAGPLQSDLWQKVDAMSEDGSLYGVIMHGATEGLQFETDTRNSPGFTGPALFISFATEDLETVESLCNELFKRKRRYFCLADPFVGLGHTPRENSIGAVEQSDAVLLLCSLAYADRVKLHPNGNLSAEINAMMIRKARDPAFQIIVLSTTRFDNLTEALSWRELGFVDGQVPMVGSPLLSADGMTDEGAVRHAMDFVKL